MIKSNLLLKQDPYSRSHRKMPRQVLNFRRGKLPTAFLVQLFQSSVIPTAKFFLMFLWNFLSSVCAHCLLLCHCALLRRAWPHPLDTRPLDIHTSIDKIPPQSPLPWTEQSQVSQPFLIWEALKALITCVAHRSLCSHSVRMRNGMINLPLFKITSDKITARALNKEKNNILCCSIKFMLKRLVTQNFAAQQRRGSAHR